MRIGVLADAVGLTTKAIRFYEQIGLLPEPARTTSGYRDYSPEILTRLGFIRDAQAAGFSLAEVGQILAIRDSGAAPCEHVRELIDQHLTQIERRIAELTQTQVALQQLQRRAGITEPGACTGGQICTILEPARD